MTETHVKVIQEIEDRFTEQVRHLKAIITSNSNGIDALAMEPAPRPKRARYPYRKRNFRGVNESSSTNFPRLFCDNGWPCGTHGQT